MARSGAFAVLDSAWRDTGFPRVTRVIGTPTSLARRVASGELDVVISDAPVLEPQWLRCPFVRVRAARFSLYAAPRPWGRHYAQWAIAAGRKALAGVRLADGTRAFVALPGPCADPVPLLGAWEYRSPPPSHTAAPGPRLNAGLQFALHVDSMSGATFSGSVVRWFSGDVGVRRGTFGPVRGHTDDSLVTFEIPYARAGPPPLVIVTRRVAPDLLEVVTATRGGAPAPIPPGAHLLHATW